MDCRTARELLPWLLNKSLDPSEEAKVEEHLASCEACQAELRETRIALAVAGQHLPVEALVAHAHGRDPGVDVELFQTHLASCSACAEELALLRESHTALTSDQAPSSEEATAEEGRLLSWRAARSSSVAWWRGAAAAAALVTVTIGFVAFSGHREASRLAERLAELQKPRPNVALVDLYPDELVLRTGESEEPPARIPASSARATLILNSQQPPSAGPFRLEIRDPGGRTVYEVEGLTPDADGLLTLSLGTAALPSGELVLTLLRPGTDPQEPLEIYRLQIR